MAGALRVTGECGQKAGPAYMPPKAISRVGVARNALDLGKKLAAFLTVTSSWTTASTKHQVWVAGAPNKAPSSRNVPLMRY